MPLFHALYIFLRHASLRSRKSFLRHGLYGDPGWSKKPAICFIQYSLIGPRPFNKNEILFLSLKFDATDENITNKNLPELYSSNRGRRKLSKLSIRLWFVSFLVQHIYLILKTYFAINTSLFVWYRAIMSTSLLILFRYPVFWYRHSVVRYSNKASWFSAVPATCASSVRQSLKWDSIRVFLNIYIIKSDNFSSSGYFIIKNVYLNIIIYYIKREEFITLANLFRNGYRLWYQKPTNWANCH